MNVVNAWGSSRAIDIPAGADVCIVGTGAAGAAVAAELAGGPARVVILESGDTKRRAEADALNDVENVGRARKPDQYSVRNRVLGGSTHTWGGRVAPFDEIDFEERSWVPHSGWPFDRASLGPYLERSAGLLGLAVADASDDRFYELAPRARFPFAPDPKLIRPMYWQLSRDPDESYPFEYRRFGRDAVERLGPRQTLVTGATVVEITQSPSGDAVTGVIYALPSGERRILRARIVVLCTGGIENTRVLLASDAVTPGGIGNAHGHLGRYLMDHPRGSAAHFDPADTRPLQHHFGRFNTRGHLFRAGVRLSPELQRSEKLLNAAAYLGEEFAQDDPWIAMRWLVRGGGPSRVQSARDIARNLPFVARGAGDYLIRRTGVPRKLATIRLDVMVEQRPDPESRVTLSARTDRFGVPLPRIDWRVHPDEARSARRLAELVTTEFPKMGLPAPVLDDWVRAGEDLPVAWVDVAHPTGTTRMSARAEDGVVDPDGAVHGVSGLFVTGSSTFPTAGHCNPTQMIVALAIKTSDAVRSLLAAPESAAAANDHSAARAARPDDSDTESAAEAETEAAGAAGRRRTVLVTGATGRIGRVVVSELVERGFAVRATTSGALGNSSDDIEWRSLDLGTASAGDFDLVVAGVDGIVHLAAALGDAPTMPRVNTVATGLLAQAAERAGVAAFCYTSTVSVYGSPRQRRANETSPVLTLEADVPDEYLAMDYVRQYGRTKLAGEREIAAHASRSRYVVFRPTVVVDVPQLLAIREWDIVKRFLTAHRTTHHIYVRDVADAIVWALERMWSGEGTAGDVETFNLGEPTAAGSRYRDFMRDAYAASGDRRFRVIALPGVLDYARDLLRFRRLPTRRPLWATDFPTGRLASAGYRPRYGIAYARSLALTQLRGTTEENSE